MMLNVNRLMVRFMYFHHLKNILKKIIISQMIQSYNCIYWKFKSCCCNKKNSIGIEGHLRISIAIDMKSLEEAMKRLKSILNS